jgi:hypothetical protein
MNLPAITTTESETATLWVTDAELIRRLGVPEKTVRENLRMFDAKPGSGFPQKQKLWGNKRYWPAVKTYFDAQYGVKIAVSATGRERRYETAR